MIRIADMTHIDLGEAIRLWEGIPKLRFSPAFDTVARLERFLRKNPGLSAIAREGEALVGALLCGEDGRRGFFYHTGVLPALRRKNIAGRMVGHTLEKLRENGIDTCFLFTNDFNLGAQAF